MKKILLGTSAVALVGAFANSAYAVDWDVKVGGYMEQYAAWSSPDVDGIISDDYDGIDSKQDSEIHFLPSITLDNGLKIGANVQLEGFSGGDNIDEAFLFIDGSFGRVLLGSENSAGYLMHYGAPDVTFLNVNSGSLTAFVPFSGSVVGQTAFDFDPTVGFDNVATLAVGDDVFRGTLGSTYLENGRNNDAQRFTYFTPRFAGFQLGVSYARDPNQDSNAQLNLDVQNPDLSNIFDVGANYVNSFGAFDVAVSGRYGIAANNTGLGDIFPGGGTIFDEDVFDGNPTVWSAGLNLGFAGFTVGGSFSEQNNTFVEDGQSWDAGLAYETGPWGISFTYFHGRNTDNETSTPAATPSGFRSDPLLGRDETLQEYLLGVNYDLAKGVALNAFGAYVQFDEEVGDTLSDGAGGFVTINPTGDDVDGWVVGTGIKVSF